MTIRGPLYTPRQSRRPSQQEQVNNLLLTTLASVPVTKPFNCQDWPVPKRRPQSMAMHVFYAMSYLETGYPFVYPDLVQPKSKHVAPITDQPLNFAIRQVVATVMPFNQQHWPIPTTKHARATEVIQDFQTFIALQPTPTIRFEWELPTKKGRTYQPDLIPNLALINAPIAPTPNVSQEMQNPFKRGKTQQPDVLQNLQLSLYAVFPQIRQEISDPVKRGKTQQPPHVWQGLANFYAQQPTPKIAQEHQNPVKRGKTQQPFEFQNLPLNTLLVPDSTPDAFSFTDQTNVALNTLIISDPITVTGINQSVAISVTGGSYSINGGAFTSTAGTVNNGDVVRAQITSSSSVLTATNAVVTIGGISDTFTATTSIGEDTRVIVPYLIGSTVAHATQQLASVYLNIAVSGTTGTVTAQDVPHMSLVARYTTVTVTLGGPFNNPGRGKRLPTYNAPDRLQ